MTKKRTINVETGSAMLLVIWILAVMGVIAIFLYYRGEVEWAANLSLESRLKAEKEVEKIFYERWKLVKNDKNDSDDALEDWFGKGYLQYEQDDYQINIIVEDESSKLNLNFAEEADLQQLVTEQATTDQVSLDPVFDWLDDDLERRESRPEGAETEYYQALKTPYKARDGFFSTLVELKELKNGQKIYDLLAPIVTVYNKPNINTLSSEKFVAILKAAGYKDLDLINLKARFEIEQLKKTRYEKLNDLSCLGVLFGELDRLGRLIQFRGSCNPNFASSKMIELNLRQAGYASSNELAQRIIQKREIQPFGRLEELENFLGERADRTKKLLDYFTLQTTLIRYRIWRLKEMSSFYLETVQERQADPDHQDEWLFKTISWRTALNEDVPKVPDQVIAPVVSANLTTDEPR